MDEIREIYHDYIIISKNIVNKSFRVEMDVLVAPSVKSLYKWLWECGVVSTKVEILEAGGKPKKEDEDVVHYFILFVHKYHYTYTESARIYLDFNCGCSGRQPITEERIIEKIRKKIDVLPMLKRELALFLWEKLSIEISPDKVYKV